MKKNFFYWSPFLTHVGTVKSTINSAIALKRYSHYEPIVINVCGEWDEYLELFKLNNVRVIDIYKFSYKKIFTEVWIFKK